MMRLELDTRQEVVPVQTQKVSARLVAANQMLQLSSQELHQAIAAELADNPALELVETPSCQVCGSELEGTTCPRCIQRQKGEAYESVDEADSYRERDLQPNLSDEAAFDPLLRVAGEQTLAEHLLAELGMLLPESELGIAEYLVGSLDEHGYLACSVEEIADELEVTRTRVQAVLRTLQSLEPVGVGARNLRECLLIQIDRLEGLGQVRPFARQIISDFLTELGEHRLGRIAELLGIRREQVAEVWKFVKTKLNPHPAQGCSATNALDRETRQMYIRPDVIISRGPDGYEVEVVESRRFLLQISPLYQRLSTRLREAEANCSPEEQQHIRQYVGRAKLFIGNINQRRHTIHQITRCLTERQQAYLEHGVRHLSPLTRADVALEIGVHESTVSRATAGKYVMLPNGEIIPFAHFFTPSLSVKDVLKEIVEREGAPLTDEKICDRLRQRGVTIARRTVAKYRAQLAILPSPLR